VNEQLHLVDLLLCALSGKSNAVAVSVFDVTSKRKAWRVVTAVHHTASAASALIIPVPQPELSLPFQLQSHNDNLDHFS